MCVSGILIKAFDIDWTHKSTLDTNLLHTKVEKKQKNKIEEEKEEEELEEKIEE